MKKISVLMLLLISSFGLLAQGYRIEGGTYGETTHDRVTDIATDANGNVFICGYTNASYFDGNPSGFTHSYSFVIKYNNSMTKMLGYILLGGNSVTSSGQYWGETPVTVAKALTIYNDDVYVVGITATNDFPTTPGAFKTSLDSTELKESFLVKLDNDLNLQYATYGAFYRFDDIKISNNKIFVVGLSNYIDNHAYMTGLKKSWVNSGAPGTPEETCDKFEGIILRFDINGTQIERGTYFGGPCSDFLYALDTDPSGNIYVTGEVGELDPIFVKSVYPYDEYQGDIDGVIAKLHPDLDSIIYCQYLGGSSTDRLYDIDVKDGYAHVCGETFSYDVVGLNGYKTWNSYGSRVPIVAKIKTNGEGFEYNTYIAEVGCFTYGIVVDNCDNATVVGRKFGGYGFPAVNAFTSDHDKEDSYMFTLNSSGTGLIFSSLLNFETNYYSDAMAIHFGSDNKYYVAGQSYRPTTNMVPATAYRPLHMGSQNGYIFKLASNLCNCGQFICPSTYLDFISLGVNDSGECCYEINMASNEPSCVSNVRLYDVTNSTEIWVKSISDIYDYGSGSGIQICGEVGDKVRVQYGFMSGGIFYQYNPSCYNELEFKSQDCPTCDCDSFWKPGYDSLGDYGLHNFGRVNGKCCYGYQPVIDIDPMACPVYGYDIIINGEIYNPDSGTHTFDTNVDLRTTAAPPYNWCFDDSEFDSNGNISIQIKYYDENGGLICDDHTFNLTKCPEDCCNLFQSIGYMVDGSSSDSNGCCWNILYDLRPLWSQSLGNCDVSTYAFSEVKDTPTVFAPGTTPMGLIFDTFCAPYVDSVAHLTKKLTVIFANGDTCSLIIDEICVLPNCCSEINNNLSTYHTVDKYDCEEILWDYYLHDLDSFPCNATHFATMSVQTDPNKMDEFIMKDLVDGEATWTWQALNGTNAGYHPGCDPPYYYYFAMYRLAFYNDNNELICYKDIEESCCVEEEISVCGKSGKIFESKEIDMHNIPNPAEGYTNIYFNLPEESSVQLELFDVLGKSYGIIQNATYDEGWQKFELNTEHFASGTYLVRLNANGKTATQKFQIR